ncbi:MAG: hypothetical protein MR860_05365 [Prevotella sp.]|nr:hypothetical protein [Prevotella sp.]
MAISKSLLKKPLRAMMLLALLVCTCGMQAQFYSAPAFPGAEGFGRYTTGGRGGKVIHVTNLNDSGTGSLRAAIKTDGARIIVFDVAGTIELQSDLKIEKDNCTILGQTAPGGGICLRNYTLHINANNVIVRFIRCRMGDTAGNENDAMSASHKTGSYKKNIIIDHCSVSWCVDECGSFYGNENFTMQWCILSESLTNSVHDKGSHGYGGIWGGDNAAFHHNLLAHHNSRNPRFDHGYLAEHAGIVDYINNVVYNWGGNSTYGGENKKGLQPKKFNMINNYYKPGPRTINVAKTQNRLLNPTTKCSNCNSSDQYGVVPGKFYINGNKVNGTTVSLTTSSTSCSNITFDSGYSFTSFVTNCLSNSRYKSSANDFGSYNTISLHSADNAFTKTVQYAGASYKRDAIDTRIANETKNGTYTYTGSNGSTYGLIDTQGDVGGWPTLSGTKQTDSDNDGIPDAWETAHGLSNSKDNSATYTLDSRGYYTDLEVYANYLVQDITKAERADASATFTEYYPLDAASSSSSTSTTTIFSLKNKATSNVSVAAGGDLNLSSYATISGGSALVHNGHASSAANMVSASGVTTRNSGGSYIKITLSSALQEGDVLTTTGDNGGYVATAYTNSSSDNISSNKFTFTSAYNGVKTIYIMRGASKPYITGITITRKASSIEWDFSEFTSTVTASGSNYTTSYNGLTLVGNSNSSYTSDYISATAGFHMNGTSSSTNRHIKYTPSENGTLTVYYVSNNSTATDRITAIGTKVTTGTSLSVGSNGVLAYGYTNGYTEKSISASLTAGTTYYAYFANGGQSIKKLVFTPGSSSNAKAVSVIAFEEEEEMEATAVTNVEVGQPALDADAIYTLDGRKVSANGGKLPAGIYIKNKKKFLVR